jgi:hypothetical protein
MLAAEKGARITGDTNLQNNINTESHTRETADTTLANHIDSVNSALTNAISNIPKGAPGLACWDLNGNGICDPDENKDGIPGDDPAIL